jgi:hypothetical protein
VVGVVLAAVRELLADPPADLDPELRCHGDVTAIEKNVQIGAEQELCSTRGAALPPRTAECAPPAAPAACARR